MSVYVCMCVSMYVCVCPCVYCGYVCMYMHVCAWKIAHRLLLLKHKVQLVGDGLY